MVEILLDGHPRVGPYQVFAHEGEVQIRANEPPADEIFTEHGPQTPNWPVARLRIEEALQEGDVLRNFACARRRTGHIIGLAAVLISGRSRHAPYTIHHTCSHGERLRGYDGRGVAKSSGPGIHTRFTRLGPHIRQLEQRPDRLRGDRDHLCGRERFGGDRSG